jgi:hypothetical protein
MCYHLPPPYGLLFTKGASTFQLPVRSRSAMASFWYSSNECVLEYSSMHSLAALNSARHTNGMVKDLPVTKGQGQEEMKGQSMAI